MRVCTSVCLCRLCACNVAFESSKLTVCISGIGYDNDNNSNYNINNHRNNNINNDNSTHRNNNNNNDDHDKGDIALRDGWVVGWL